MKPATNLYRTLVVTFGLAICAVNGQEHGDSRRFSGSESTTEKAAEKGETVAIAKIVSTGRQGRAMFGAVVYYNVQIEIVRTLKGTIGPTAQVALFLRNGDVEEALPEVGKPYVFFLHKDRAALVGIKILEADEESVAKVTGILAKNMVK